MKNLKLTLLAALATTVNALNHTISNSTYTDDKKNKATDDKLSDAAKIIIGSISLVGFLAITCAVVIKIVKDNKRKFIVSNGITTTIAVSREDDNALIKNPAFATALPPREPHIAAIANAFDPESQRTSHLQLPVTAPRRTLATPSGRPSTRGRRSAATLSMAVDELGLFSQNASSEGSSGASGGASAIVSRLPGAIASIAE